jgi:hypothetical protein
MRGREVRILVERLVECSLGIAEVAVGLLRGELVVFERRGTSGRGRQSRESVSFISMPHPWGDPTVAYGVGCEDPVSRGVKAP